MTETLDHLPASSSSSWSTFSQQHTHSSQPVPAPCSHLLSLASEERGRGAERQGEEEGHGGEMEGKSFQHWQDGREICLALEISLLLTSVVFYFCNLPAIVATQTGFVSFPSHSGLRKNSLKWEISQTVFLLHLLLLYFCFCFFSSCPPCLSGFFVSFLYFFLNYLTETTFYSQDIFWDRLIWVS